MLGFEFDAAASLALAGTGLLYIMRKLQGNFDSTALLSRESNSQRPRHNCACRSIVLRAK
ncbi:hypothetical protein FHW03_004337 [Ochrobactrum sp. RH2CCR150]|nr:hypothetical protein [Ochrobactrum sp. RH2CCR150]